VRSDETKITVIKNQLLQVLISANVAEQKLLFWWFS